MAKETKGRKKSPPNRRLRPPRMALPRMQLINSCAKPWRGNSSAFAWQRWKTYGLKEERLREAGDREATGVKHPQDRSAALPRCWLRLSGSPIP